MLGKALLAGMAVAAVVGSPARGAENDLVEQARAFMAEYAEDLAQGRREAIVDRYHPRGCYRLGSGRKELRSREELARIYRERWRRPASFAWRELSFEQVGPDAVVVVGLFDWGTAQEGVRTFSYTGLLVRHEGRLKIRLEDESAAPK